MIGIISNIVKELPEILSYFISGFVFLQIFCFLNSKVIGNFNLILIWSVIISYLIKGIVNIADEIIAPTIQLLPWTEFLFCIIVSLVLVYVVNSIYNGIDFQKYVGKLNHKSVNDDIWKDIIDYDLGTSLKVFLNDSTIYIGKLTAHEEKGKDSWFVFSEYIAVYPNGEEYNSKDATYPTLVAIILQEIKRIELYYNENSAIFN